MTSMENAIEQAAQVMARAYFGEPVEHDMVCAIEWARALAEAGLLAPGGRVQPDKRTMSGNAFWFLDDEWTLTLNHEGILFGDDNKQVVMTRDEAELLARCLDSAVVEHDSNAAAQKL